jgi:YD repeat-containing protein
MACAGVKTFEYLYDKDNRLTKVVDGADTTYFYPDPGGRVTKVTYGNSAKAEYVYDAASRLTSLAHKKADDSVIASYAYAVDAVGTPTKMTYDTGDTVEYAFDALSRLTLETKKDAQAQPIYSQTFSLDLVGNRTQLVTTGSLGAATTTYTYNNGHALLTKAVGGVNTAYQYDAKRNRVRSFISVL